MDAYIVSAGNIETLKIYLDIAIDGYSLLRRLLRQEQTVKALQCKADMKFSQVAPSQRHGEYHAHSNCSSLRKLSFPILMPAKHTRMLLS
eukprot:TRINITY_DN7048_c0_g1_i1.p1 TRINITY_DN7048_c0_g1~~TRINITY_DN7048_c0_g1_i1.p1  ORF type:complete len:102 (+),score=5.54 TRINITY_DN7048_c0_g1_i1:38-307(+)